MNILSARGPFRIVASAVVLTAAIAAGVLFVINSPNRPQPIAGSAAAPASPTASAAASPSGSPTGQASAAPAPAVALASFVCDSSTLTAPQSPAVAFIDGVRTGTHAGYDRLTIEFQNGQPGSIEVSPQSGTIFTRSPRGDRVALAGQNGILILGRGADAHTAYSGSTDIKTAYPVLLEARQLEDFEGYVQWGIGLAKPACYRAFVLTNPTRLVIDIQTS
jgi:hypothetical protein